LWHEALQTSQFVHQEIVPDQRVVLNGGMVESHRPANSVVIHRSEDLVCAAKVSLKCDRASADAHICIQHAKRAEFAVNDRGG
jgi:hypothetical protein